MKNPRIPIMMMVLLVSAASEVAAWPRYGFAVYQSGSYSFLDGTEMFGTAVLATGVCGSILTLCAVPARFRDVFSMFTNPSLWNLWGQQEESVPSPCLRVNAIGVRRDIDGQLKPSPAVIRTTGGQLLRGDSGGTSFCSPRTKAKKGAPLNDRKVTSSLDETARSESTDQGVHLFSGFRRSAERPWLFAARATDRTYGCAALSCAVAAGGLL